MVGVVLAAGSSSRFGSDKLTQRLGDRSVVEHVVAAALSADLDEVVVVVRRLDDPIARVLPGSERVRPVANPDHRRGLAGSLVKAIASVSLSAEAIVVLLGDEPEITSQHIREVVRVFRISRAKAARASYGGEPGHPVVIGPDLWPALTTREGDSGAGEVLAGATGVELVDLPFPRPIDIDTPDDLDRVRRRLSNL